MTPDRRQKIEAEAREWLLSLSWKRPGPVVGRHRKPWVEEKVPSLADLIERLVDEAVAKGRKALRKRWIFGDEENGQGVYVEYRGRRYGQGPELWAVTQLSSCLNRDGEWEFEPQPSSRSDAFIARCRWHSCEEAVLAALDARASQGPDEHCTHPVCQGEKP